MVDCEIVYADLMKNKRLRLNRLDAWWTVDWIYVDLRKNKRLRLNRLDAWWTVDWYGGPYHVNSIIL
jgi:hypothetical protein